MSFALPELERDPGYIREKFLSKTFFEPNSGCQLWEGAAGRYGFFRAAGVVGHERLTHRVSWLLHKGEIPENMQVLHKCDTPLCVRPDHLFLGSHDENQIDKIQKERQARGQMLSTAKLCESDIPLIRNDPRPNKEIAASYGVTATLIRMVKNRKAWRHV